MNRKTIAIIVGCLGIVCSLSFWAWAVIYAMLSFHQRGALLSLSLGKSNLWPVLWALGFLLPLVAAFLWSKRWIYAAILPIVSCAAAVLLAARIQM
jgi:hypothetical protein